MSAFLILLFASNVNKGKDVQEQFNIVSEIYAGEGEQGAYDQAFGALRKKNKTTLTAEVENSAALPLERTFGGNIGNYRIYGNSVQNGTPSPTNPVEIQSVGDRTKNLFNPNDPNVIKTNCEMQIDGNNVIEKPNGDKQTALIYPLKLKKNTYYTVSGSFQMINSEEYNGGGSVWVRTSTTGGSDYVFGTHPTFEHPFSSEKVINDTFNSGSYETVYLWLYFQMGNNGEQKNGNSYGIYKNIQIEEGTTATAYEPYGYKVPVQVSGKNLFDIDGAVNENLIKNDDGTYTIWKNKENNDGRLSKRLSINIPAQTKITVSVDIVDYNGTYSLPFQIVCFPKDGGEEYIQFMLNEKHKTYSFSKEITRMTIYQESRMPVGTYTTFKNLQIELGETATAYEPYHAPVTTNIYLNEPLRKEGEKADYLDFKTGKVVRLDGTTETVELPELPAFEDYSKIEVLTTVSPSKIQAEYEGYTIK